MINAFREIRLTNSNLKVSGVDSRLYVGQNTTVFQNETGSFITSAQTGLFYPASNPSGYITSAQAGGVQTIGVSGGTVSGAVVITGLGGTIVSRTGQTVYVSTDLSAYALSANTGSFVTTSQTGVFATAANLASTGSTFAAWTGKFQSLVTSITPTGLDNYFIQFPLNFSSAPRVVASVEVTGNVMYNIAVQSRTISGYTCLFSDLVAESGVSVNTIATLN